MENIVLVGRQVNNLTGSTLRHVGDCSRFFANDGDSCRPLFDERHDGSVFAFLKNLSPDVGVADLVGGFDQRQVLKVDRIDQRKRDGSVFSNRDRITNRWRQS